MRRQFVMFVRMLMLVREQTDMREEGYMIVSTTPCRDRRTSGLQGWLSSER